MARRNWKQDENYYRGGTIIFRNVKTKEELFISKEMFLWEVSVGSKTISRDNLKSQAFKSARAYMRKH